MAESTRLAGRNGEIWRAYCRGATMEDLAGRYGVTMQRVSQIIEQVADSIPQQERKALVDAEVDFFRQTRTEIMDLWLNTNGAPVTAGKDGVIVRDPETGEVVRDHTGRLNALNIAERYSARMHKLLGLDAPLAVHLTGEEAEAAKTAAAEALAHLHGGPDAQTSS